jgi:hypothetical protein
MMICSPRRFAFAMMVAGLPLGYAFAGGSGHGGGGVGGGVGAAGMGSAAVGGGAPAGRVGGGPPAGAVGGGSPGSSRPAGNGAAGTDNPALNATGGGSGVNAPEIRSTTTTGGFIGGGEGSQTTGAAPARNLPGGGLPPGAVSQEGPSAAQSTPPNQGLASTQEPADDVLLKPVPARPCGLAAHETDGTTTCIGIPDRPHRRR